MDKMKRWIRRWLGIDEILDQLQAIRYENRGQYGNIERRLEHIENRVTAITPGLARIIAKLDPMYGRSEFDPDRIAESNKLEKEILDKLWAEHVASNRIPE
jgi:hypothetical protein